MPTDLRRLSLHLPALAAGALLAFAPAPARPDFFTVSTTADAGAGSLRAAITAANADVTPPHTIDFEIPGTGPFTITLASALPAISRQTFVDASGEKIAEAPGVRLDGSGLASGSGLVFAATADGSGVSYLSITGFPSYGIMIASDSTAVTRCYVGVLPDGSTAAGNDGSGIRLDGALATIGTATAGNVVSGNGAYGIDVAAGAGFSAIRGNLIGTDATGLTAVPNASFGISSNAAVGVSVGGNEPGDGNVISGNVQSGINVTGTAELWAIQGNRIGVGADGTTPIPNQAHGMHVESDDHLIGSTDPDGRNVISGNLHYGVELWTGADGVEIRGNYIGTDASGGAAVGVQTVGIRGFGSPTGCTIGGSTAAYRNVISGNTSRGIEFDAGVTGCVVMGNYIGLDAAGAAAVPNAGGVGLSGGGNTLGGDTPGERNVISGNTFNGIDLWQGGDAIIGNYIGTDATGAAAVPNGDLGLRVFGAGATIGGATSGERNVISGNSDAGISFESGSSGGVATGNWIGLNAAGIAALPNGGGVRLHGNNNAVGGSTAGERNVISGNQFQGVVLAGSGNAIRGNFIGTNPAGTAAIGNASSGIRVVGATNGVVGGVFDGEGNVVSGNGFHGVTFDADTSACLVAGNRIGTDANGTAAVANAGSGVSVGGGGHTIGGQSAGARNLISGNAQHGVVLGGSGNFVHGNYIGTNLAGGAALGNGGYGVRIYEANGGELGGAAAASGNVVSGNTRGVSIEHGSTGVLVRNNVIGLDAGGTVDLADSGTGIEIYAAGNTIGAPGQGNVVAGMSFQGVILGGAESTGNVIQGNWIGTNAALAGGLGNAQLGIFVTDAHGNTIGGTGAGEGNVIANNGYIGLWVERGEGNEVSGNSFFGNGLLGIDVGEQGVFPNDGGDGDGGGNRSQNYPLLSSVVVDGATTEVDGLLVNEPSTEYRVELFSSPSCDSTGFGEGRTFLGSTLVTTGAAGQATLATTIPAPVADPFVTATVTDPLGNTSEFSPCAAVGGPGPGKIQFYRDVVLAYEDGPPTGDTVLTRSHGLSGAVSVSFTSSDDTAFAGSDYTDSDQVVTFQPWEVVKVVKIPILVDPASEGNPEVAGLALSAPTGGATLGLAASDLLIFDGDEAFPGLAIGDAFVDEGDAGDAVMTFEVHLSPTDHPVTVAYQTEPGSAAAGVDYESSQGTIDFATSALPQTVEVQVTAYGDTDVEGDEVFWVRIMNHPGGGNWVAFDAYGLGEIRDDDGDDQNPAPPSVLFADAFELGSTVLWSLTVPAP